MSATDKETVKQENLEEKKQESIVSDMKKVTMQMGEDELVAQLDRLGPDARERLLRRLSEKQEQPGDVKPSAGDLDSAKLEVYMEKAFSDPIRKTEIGYHPFEDRLQYRQDYRQQDVWREIPKLPIFSGIKDKDTSFGRWRYEVRCLQKNFSESLVQSAIHRSLKSPAADVLIHMEDAGLQDLLYKLEALYGTDHVWRCTSHQSVQ